MQELEYNHHDFVSQREADKNLAVKFYHQPIRNEWKSVNEGRPIYDDTEMIEIRIRGDRNNVVQRPVRPEDKQRFGQQYDHFKRGLELAASGTPLAEWPVASASMVEELKYFGFYTVEQLAEASDSVCSKMPGLTSMKQRARAFLDLSKGTAPLEQLQAKLEETESANKALQAQVVDLGRRLAAMESERANQVNVVTDPQSPVVTKAVVQAPAAKTR